MQRTSTVYQKRDKSPQGRSRSATGGGGKFFRASSRRAPLASLPPFPLLAPLALNPCFCSFLLASGVHKLVLSLALSTHSAVKKGGTMTKRIGERGGYSRFPRHSDQMSPASHKNTAVHLLRKAWQCNGSKTVGDRASTSAAGLSLVRHFSLPRLRASAHSKAHRTATPVLPPPLLLPPAPPKNNR